MARQTGLRPEQALAALDDIASARSEEDMLFENIESDFEPMSSSNELEENMYEHLQHADEGLPSRNKRSFKADESSVPSKVPRRDTGARRSSNRDEVSHAVPEKSTNEQGVMALLEEMAALCMWDDSNESDSEPNGERQQRWSCACGECTDRVGGSKQRTRLHERALRKAVEGGDAAVVAAILLCACADPFFWQEKRLKHALMVVRTAAVAQVFACAAPVFFWQKGYGVTALLRAAKEGREDAVRALLAAGVAADAALPGKAKALRIAVCRGHSACVQALLEFGADPNQTVRGNMKPLHLSLCAGDMESVQSLLRWGADVEGVAKRGDTPIHCAAGFGNLDFVRVLLDAGADPNTHGDRGYTALHLLAGYNCVKAVLESGIDLNVPTASGKTPVHFAAEYHLNSLELLREKGADLHARDHGDWNALHFAVACDNIHYVEFLLKHGFSLGDKTSDGETPLHLAARSIWWGGGRSICQLTCKFHPGVNARDSTGRTPLHAAARSNNASNVRALLEAGAERLAQDDNGDTPADVTTNDSIKILIQKWALAA